MLGASRLAYLGFQATTAVAATGRTPVTLQPNGNLQIDTAQSEFGGASALFDGSGDYLSFDANVLNDLPGNDYTMEMWARFSDTGTFRTLLANQGTNGAVFLQRDNTNKISLFYVGDSATLSTTSTVTSGVWYHIALVVDGGTQKLFLDGTLEASRTETTYTSTTNSGMLGRRQSVTSRDMNGHIDEFRISNVARYTASFTPSTTPFVNDENTLILAHMNGTDAQTDFFDDTGTGRSAVGISAIDNAQVDLGASKFGGAACLMNANDALEAQSDNFQLPGDFTIEFWGNLQGSNSGSMIRIGNTSDTWASGVLRLRMSSGSVVLESYDGINISSTISSYDYTWRHWAIVRSGSTVTLYKDGVSQGTDTDSNTIGGSVYNKLVLGYGSWGSWAGYFDEVRVSDTARYTSGFTPDTTPFVNDTNTLLLAHMDGTDSSTTFLDDNGVDRSSVGISAIGNVQVDTAQSYFGSTSAYFDGTTDDYMKVPSSTFNIGVGDFTVECWMRTTASNHQGLWHLHTDSDYFPESTGGLAIAPRVDLNGWVYYANGKTTTTTIDCNVNTWYHVALVRSTGTTTLYIDGTSASSKLDSVNYSGTFLNLGAYYSNLYTFTGHIDEFRISNTARYTGLFTVPTQSFVNDSNTLLLAHMDGTDGSSTFIDDNGTK